MLTPPRDVSPNIRRQDKMFTDEDYDPVTKKQRNKDLKKYKNFDLGPKEEIVYDNNVQKKEEKADKIFQKL